MPRKTKLEVTEEAQAAAKLSGKVMVVYANKRPYKNKGLNWNWCPGEWWQQVKYSSWYEDMLAVKPDGETVKLNKWDKISPEGYLIPDGDA